MFCGLLAMVNAQAATTNVTVNVVDHAGNPVNGFRWLLEEDTTHPVTPGVDTTDALSLTFHASHTPVVKQGESTTSDAVIEVDDTKRYFVSVLPFTGYSNGGAKVSLAAAATTVVVAQHPIPTAQISIFAYEDTQPINNAPDLPQEVGLSGFSVMLFDAAGQYGAAGGRVSQDAFGNPLGTSYNADGSVLQMGNGVILTGPDGVARVKYLAPGKYGVQLVPPAGQNWVQTHTIEGTKTIDAWVKANEPSFFTEFGPPGHHVFVGFIKPFDCFNAPASAPADYCTTATPTTGVNISGKIVNLHASRPPDVAFYNGHPIPGCWVGLNSAPGATGRGIYAAPCNDDSTFTITNVPPGGPYQLVVWDKALDVIFARLDVVVPNEGLALGEVPVFNWFHRMENTVFFDRNQNGFRDCVTVECNDMVQDDVPLKADQAFVNLRFRDGRIYQTMPIDVEGAAPFDEVFPFFHWLVAEVSFSTLKATGMTATIDAGGPVVPGEVLNPQPQTCSAADVSAGVTGCAAVGAPLINPNTSTNLSRTETGPVLTQAFQGFLGQTNRVEWGKVNYGPNENGGISGVVLYAITRAENDPRYAVGEEWEPGIPRVQVNLYRDADGLGGIADNDGLPGITLADVDNHPLGWSDGSGAFGPEDLDRNGNGIFELGDALRFTHTDSFDDSHPTGCQGDVYTAPNGVVLDCYDGMRNFNQVRPGVFDGGYAFGAPDDPLPAGLYVVEATVPPGYKIVKEEDKNVDFGDTYTPSPLLLPNICVGEPHTVPDYLTMQTDEAGVPYAGIATADLVAAPYATTQRPLCDRRQVRLTQGQNAAADFFLFTETPKAAMVVGFILNDLGNEFDPNAPNFGEKFAPPWLPVSFRDWTGREIVRTYSDANGKFNAMLPSTYSVHIPMPSGVSPNMITACMNDAGPIPNPALATDPAAPPMIVDPNYDRRYSQFCYTFQYMPGGTTYLDTPVVPIAAFAGAGNPLDCEQPNNAPLVHAVYGPSGNGPLVNVGQTLTITSVGDMVVPNPDSLDGVTNPTVTRHYGFGATKGTVKIGGVTLADADVTMWADDMIQVTVPSGTVTGQLSISRADGLSAPSGVTVTVGPLPNGVTAHFVQPSATPGATPIQDAIDMAAPSDLILLAPGTYDELVVMYKPVRLQGSGAYSTVINARKAPAEKLHNWRTKVATLLTSNAFDLLPGQGIGFTPADNEPILLFDGEGAGVTVLAKRTGPNRFRAANNARIDGITVTGADHGGAIFVNGYAGFLEISNNRLIANQGLFGGGIRVGHADLVSATNNGVERYTDANNDNLNIHNNEVSQNGSLGGAGGGIALYTGADNYRVNANYICGNFSTGNGGGVGHLGVSTNGRITSNVVLFNQSFNQGVSVAGGGIYIGGQAPLLGSVVSPGAGNVMIDGNLIQGNHAGAGDGGGIHLERINGDDVAGNPRTPSQWNRIDIINNMVVNNVAGYAGGGITLVDALRVNIDHNTIAHNDSTATAGEAFTPGVQNQSNPQPAGVVSRVSSTDLNNLLPASAAFDAYRNFSNPQLVNNIIWENRSFYWFTQGDVNNPEPFTFGLLPDVGAGQAAVFSDLAVLGFDGGLLNPQSCILTDATGYPGNSSSDPGFAVDYFNSDRGQTLQQLETTTTMQAQPAFDEGGNFIELRFGPLTPAGNYHLGAGSLAVDAGDGAILGSLIELTVDYDGEVRPQGAAPDIGADETAPVAP